MFEQVQSSEEARDLGPPKQILGIFGRAYYLPKNVRVIVMVIEGICFIAVIPWIVSMVVYYDGWWKWGIVTIAAVILRSVLIKTVLVLSGAKGIDVPVAERKRRWARSLEGQGFIPTLWVVPIGSAIFVVILTADIVTKHRFSVLDIGIDAAFIVAFVASLWFLLVMRRFIRRWTNQ